MFHIRPWEIGRLERRHYLILKAEADAWSKAREEARRGG